jgi:hypothetical protein
MSIISFVRRIAGKPDVRVGVSAQNPLPVSPAGLATPELGWFDENILTENTSTGALERVEYLKDGLALVTIEVTTLSAPAGKVRTSFKRLLESPGTPDPGTPEAAPISVYLVAGQSNASRWMRQSVAEDFATWPAYATATPGELAGVSPEFWDGDSVDPWDTTRSGPAGMGHDWISGLAGTGAAFGFQDAFAYHALKNEASGERYVFIEVAQPDSIIGLTSIGANGSWNADTGAVEATGAGRSLLLALLGRASLFDQFATANDLSYELKGVLWHQGESDATNATNASNYQANLTAIIGAVRSTLGVADLPWYMGTVCTRSTQFNANGATVRAAQKAIAAADANVYLRDNEDWAGRPSEPPGIGSGAGGANTAAGHFGGPTADRFGLWVAKKAGKVPVLPAWNVQHAQADGSLLEAFRAECCEGFDPTVIDARAVDNLGDPILATLGAQAHPNGKVYFVPDVGSTKIYAFNPVTDEIEVAATVAAQSDRSGFALAPNGLLVAAPGNGGDARNTWLVFNPTASTIAGVDAGAVSFINTEATDVNSFGTVLGADGLIYAMPRSNGATIRRLNPETLVESNFAATSLSAANAGGTLSIVDGCIYTPESTGSGVLRINTAEGTISRLPLGAGAKLSISHGPDGNLYAANFFGGLPFKVTPGSSPSIEAFGAALSGNHTLTQLGPDGRLYSPPWDGGNDLDVWDVESGLRIAQTTNWPVGPPGTNYVAGAMTTDGRLLLANKANAGNRRILILGNKQPGVLSANFVCSPFAGNW